eukprot:PhM_4_TR525/c0_g6_i1/m.102069/K20359/RABAC1, PRAF1; PRA1 family protein 1
MADPFAEQQKQHSNNEDELDFHTPHVVHTASSASRDAAESDASPAPPAPNLSNRDALQPNISYDDTAAEHNTSFSPIGECVGRVTSFVAAVRMFKDDRLRNLRPWGDFFDRNKMSVPTKTEGVSRVNRNVRHFYSNYLVVATCLSLYIAITNLNFVLSMLMCASLFWYYRMSTNDGQTSFMLRGQEVTPVTAYSSLSGLTLFLFYVTGGSSTIFWLLIATLGVVVTHAALREPPTDADVTLDDLASMSSMV